MPVRGAGVLARFAGFLPLTDATPRFTLGEGDTPLVRSVAIEKRVGAEVYFKLESLNPTASFKDRGMVVAVAKAIERGARAIVCASTGNTSASAAAYAARSGLTAFVIVPDGRIAKGKLAQAVAYGARIIAIEGSFDEALRLVREVAERHPIEVVNSINPHRIEGQKTAAFEVIEVLGDAPDFVCIPVGNAGNITAYWRGFREFRDGGRSATLPRMMGFQAEGAAPIVLGHPVKDPTTIATAIRIGNPASWHAAEAARDESGGLIAAVRDSEILDAYRLLASAEGIFAEPASAASVAGLLKLPSLGVDLAGRRVVCVLTGSGLKDPDTAMTLRSDITRVKPDAAAVDEVLGQLG
jgi:threonine synthase